MIFVCLQPDKMEVPRQKRKYEKKQKVLPLSSGASHHQGPAVFNAKDLNQYDFPSSDDEPFSQVPAPHTVPTSPPSWSILAFRCRFWSCCNLEPLFTAAFGLFRSRRGERPRWRLRLSQEVGLPVLRRKWRRDWSSFTLIAISHVTHRSVAVGNALFLPPASSGLCGELAVVWPRGGRPR